MIQFFQPCAILINSRFSLKLCTAIWNESWPCTDVTIVEFLLDICLVLAIVETLNYGRWMLDFEIFLWTMEGEELVVIFLRLSCECPGLGYCRYSIEVVCFSLHDPYTEPIFTDMLWVFQGLA
jgi:hypothetical protein